MKRYFLGIDQGTTGTTTLLIDEKWDVVASKNIEHKQIYPKRARGSKSVKTQIYDLRN